MKTSQKLMIKSEIRDKVIDSVHKLDNWVQRNGWSGYDPYDVKGHRVWLKLARLDNQANPLQKLERKLLLSLDPRYPKLLRYLFGIKKEINAKAMGLFARAYVNLYNIDRQEYYIEKAGQCISWLIENPSQGYSGLCWGYPFDWQSLIFMPRETPFGVVSSICEHAFWEFYKLTAEKKYLDACESICRFFMKDLNIDVIDDERVCFSYSPIDKFHVHNVNLLVAESLIRVGSEIGNSDFIKAGMKAINYTIREQNPDGSFYYWGPPDKILYRIDHYHTGYILRSLYSVYSMTGNKNLYINLERCYRHYLKNLFDDNLLPKLTPGSKYPISIHSCAEAIICLSSLLDVFPEGLETLEKTTTWTIKNMQDKKGYFYYIMQPRRTVKIPYIRWAQAWMLFALSTYLRLIGEDYSV